MLTISARSMAAISAAARDRSRMKVVSALRQSLPTETATFSPGGLESYFERRVAPASRFGFETEHGLYVYLAVTLLYGDDLSAAPDPRRLQAILQDEQDDPVVKAKALELQIAIDTGRRV